MTSRRIFYHAKGCALSQAVQIMLVEKRLDYELHLVDVSAFEQLDPAFLAINLSGQVPAIEFDGKVLTEAFFILCWLDERFPDPPLGGTDPAARYQVQAIGQLVERAMASNLALLEWAARGGATPAAEAYMRLPPERRALWERAFTGFPPAELSAAAAGLARALAECELWLEHHPWLAGDDYTLADVLLFPLVHRLGEGMRGAALREWYARIAARPAAALVLQEPPVVTMGPERGRWG
ncbi:MAG: glutathione S-transferase family protein [Croceibacterium sp.]